MNEAKMMHSIAMCMRKEHDSGGGLFSTGQVLYMEALTREQFHRCGAAVPKDLETRNA